MSFELLEALVTVKLSGLSKVQRQLAALKKSLGKGLQAKVTPSVGSTSAKSVSGGGGGSGKSAPRRVAEDLVRAREEARLALTEFRLTYGKIRTQSENLGEENLKAYAVQIKEVRAELLNLNTRQKKATSTEEFLKLAERAKKSRKEIRELEKALRGANDAVGGKGKLSEQRRNMSAITEASKRVNASLRTTSKRLEQLAGVKGVKELGDRLTRVKRRAEILQRSLKNAIREKDTERARKLGSAYRKTAKEARRLSRAVGNIIPPVYATKVDKARDSVGEFSNALRKLSGVGGGIGRVFRGVSGVMSQFGGGLAALGPIGLLVAGVVASIKFQMFVLGTIFRTLTAIIKRLAAALVRVSFAALRDSMRSIFAPTLGLIGLVRRLALEYDRLAVSILRTILPAATSYFAKLQKIKNLFELTFGSRAAAQFKFATDIANQYGLAIDAVQEGYASLAASFRGANISLKTAQGLFEGLTKAAIAFGSTKEQVESIFLAFEQVGSKGKLSSEELRRQLGNVLKGAFGLSAEALNKSVDELEKAIKAGAIKSGEFFEAIAKQLDKDFTEAAARSVNFVTFQLTRLENTYKSVLRTIGGLVVAPGINAVVALVEEIKEAGALTKFADSMKFVTAAIAALRKDAPALKEVLLPLFQSAWESLQVIARSLAAINIAATTVFVGTILAVLPKIAGFLDSVAAKITNAFGVERLVTFADVLAFAGAVIKNVDTTIQIISLNMEKAFLVIKNYAQAFKKFALTASIGMAILFPPIQLVIQSLFALATASLAAFKAFSFFLSDDLKNQVRELDDQIAKLQKRLQDGVGKGFEGLQGEINKAKAGIQEAFEPDGKGPGLFKDASTDLGNAAKNAADKFKPQFLDFASLQESLQTGKDVVIEKNAKSNETTANNTGLIANQLGRMNGKLDALAANFSGGRPLPGALG